MSECHHEPLVFPLELAPIRVHDRPYRPDCSVSYIERNEQALVVAIGSHTPDARELDDAVFSRASAVLVEHRETALREAGDIIQALKANALRSEQIMDFSDLAAGRLTTTTGISVYKSVGMGYQDLAVVGEALKTAATTD